ncbi:MAG: hypothetical protein R3F62_10200 [Planctomycetota bacterium]
MRIPLSVAALLAAACAVAGAQVVPAPGVVTVEAEPATDLSWDALRLRALLPDAARLLTPPPRVGAGAVAGEQRVVTSRALVEDASRLRVRLADGRTLAASVAAVDTASDAAVLAVAAPLEGCAPCALPRAQAWGALPGGPVLALLEPGATLPPGAPLISVEGELLGYAARSVRVPVFGDLALSYAWATPAAQVEPLLERAAPAGPLGWSDLWAPWGGRSLALPGAHDLAR